MSKASTIHDALIARVAAQLPSHIKLSHAYRLEKSSLPSLYQGFGVKVGPVQNTKRTLNCSMWIKRQYNVVITRKLYQNDSLDSDAKTSVEKQLFEDQILMAKDLTTNPSLDGSSTNVEFESDNGIEFVQTPDEEIMCLDTTFTVEYFESI